jgi:multiple sugar transport system ATP-binding protein
VRGFLAKQPARREFIVGIRPEDLEDASLSSEPAAPRHTFESTAEVLESIGSDVFAYFSTEHGGSSRAGAAQTLGFADDAPDSDLNLVARLDPRTRAREGEALTLGFDPRRILLFDPNDGRNLTR